MKILRYLFFGLLVFVGFILIISEPNDDGNFYAVMICKTAAGFALWWFARILHHRWHSRGELPDFEYKDNY